jgi:hypothetical protein
MNYDLCSDHSIAYRRSLRIDILLLQFMHFIRHRDGRRQERGKLYAALAHHVMCHAILFR